MTKIKKASNLKDLQARVGDLEVKWKRALADYQNLEKRVSKDQSDFVKFANAELIDKLLSVLNDFERAVKHLDDSGLNLVFSQFIKLLESEGVKPIEAKGKSFDPETMDCVELVKGKKDQVVAVTEPGYWLKARVLRPAKVKVGSGN